MNGFLAIFIKEFNHIRRERSTLVFVFVIPVLQLMLFGFAIDTKIEHIRTVVLDLDGREQSREFVEAFRNSRTFEIIAGVQDEESFDRALSSGQARVGIRIPPDFSERMLNRRQALAQVLIDGSDSQVAMTALSTANLLGFQMSLKQAKPFAEALQVAAARDPWGGLALPVEIRPRLLYNPDLLSANFFVPALVGIILQNVTVFLTAFSVVRERELGTLEQLFVTPVGRLGLLLGKLTPYAILGFLETLLVLLVMVFLFQVPIHGNVFALLALSGLFLIPALGIGLLISTLARTQVEATQFAFIFLLPSILLSGFIFPREGMPVPIYAMSFAIPVTYFLQILRGIILRAADLRDLWPSIAGLFACGVVILGLAAARFRKQLD